MLVLEYVNVQEEGVHLEGRFVHEPQASVDVLVGKDSVVIGKITHMDGDVEVLSDNLCWRMVEILDAPKLVARIVYIQDGICFNGLFNWLMLTYGLGVHEITTEYKTAYG